MKKSNEHKIERQEIVLNIKGNIAEDDLKSIQDTVVKMYKTVFGEQLDKIFSSLIPDDIELNIEKLEIEIPEIDITDFKNLEELKNQLEKKFNKIARQIILSKIKKNVGSKIPKGAADKLLIDKWNILEKFLEEGHYPGLLSTKNETLEKIFDELLLQSAPKISELIIKIAKKNKAKTIDRLVYQLHGKQLERLIAALYQKNGKETLKLIENIRRRLGQRYQAIKGQKPVIKAIWAAALDYVLKQSIKGQSLKFNEREFTQFIIEAIQKKYRHVDEEDLSDENRGVKNEFSNRYADLDVIEYFLMNGSIPFWANTESQQSVQSLFSKLSLKKLSSLQRLITKNIDNKYFIKRLLLQFSDEQIFMLMEPVTEDQRRFLEDFIEIFQSANLDPLAVLESALLNVLGSKGKFSKLEITRDSLTNVAGKSNIEFENLLDSFYNHLRFRSQKEYNLSRSELLRLLNEIRPDTQDRLESYLASYQKQKERESELMYQIDALELQLKVTPKDSEDYVNLKSTQKTLIGKLSTLLNSGLKSGFNERSSVYEFAEKKKELEIQLNSLKFKLFRINEENNSEDAKNYVENLIKIAEKEIKILNQTLGRQIESIIKKANKTVDSEELNKLKKELELCLAGLLVEKNKINNKITEIETEETVLKDGKVKISLLSKKKKLYAELKKNEAKIEIIRDILDKSPSSKPEKEEDDTDNSKLDFMIFFLQYGSIPWWAESYRTQSISSIFSEFSVDNPEKLRQAFSRVGRNPIVWQRLINQLEEKTLEKVLITLFPNFAGFAISTAIMLEKIFESGILESLKNYDAKYFKWTKVTEVLFSSESKFNPENFIKEVIRTSSRDFNLSPSSLLFYMSNLSNNNPEGRLGIFADILNPLKEDVELIELEKELLADAIRKKQEEDGIIIPEEKKLDTLSDFVLKGLYADYTWKGGLNNPEEMEKLFWELLEKQNASTENLIEKAIVNPQSRVRLSLEFSAEGYWEIVRMKGLKTLPLSRKFLNDLGKALGEERIIFAKEILLGAIAQDKDKPFIMEDFFYQLVKAAGQLTKRPELAIINEWKRKVYQLENVESTLMLTLMQVELRQLKSISDHSDDPTEKENLLQQMKALQLEYQQESQKLMYLFNKEQPQIFQDFEIPENPAALYRNIEETNTEIDKIKAKFQDNPKGENFLDQILSLRQLATLEGQLEVLELNEPLKIRQLFLVEKKLENEINLEEQKLSEIPTPKNILIPPPPEHTELDIIAGYIENDQGEFNEFIKTIEPKNRAEWVEIILEKGMVNLLEDWNIAENEQTKNINQLGLEELLNLQNNLLNSDDFNYRRVRGRIKIMIARQLLTLNKEQKEILAKIENAETTELAESLKKELLGFELKQNDILDLYLNKVGDEQIRLLLNRQRNQLRSIFQRLRLIADKRKADIIIERKEKQRNFINIKKAEKEQFERKRKEFIEQIKKDKKTKEAITNAKKDEKKRKPDKIVDAPLYIKNAGLVILHPFFNRLFTNLNLVEKNKFVSEEAQIRAVHILQYIATGKTEHPENELVLNKIICGLPLSTPVPMDIGLTEEEIRVANGLLNGAIANWPRMKTMSPDALRGTFILREGSIKEESDRWKLKVEKGSFDILLKTIPWAFTFIRSGWMPKFIMVEWPLPG